MASAIIHIAVANEVNKKLQKNPSIYLIGAIAPDIAKIVGIDRNITHFQEYDKDYPNIERFLEKYEDNLEDDFVMGYYIHLLTDYLWYKYFYTQIVDDDTITKKDGTKIKLDRALLRNYIYSDYTTTNIKLIDDYDLDLKIFYNEIPTINKIIEEIPIEKLDILVDEMGIIIKDSKEKNPHLFDNEDVNRFIDTTVKIINIILNNNEEID